MNNFFEKAIQSKKNEDFPVFAFLDVFNSSSYFPLAATTFDLFGCFDP